LREYTSFLWDRCGRDSMVIGFTTILPVPITTRVVGSNPSHVKVYLIQYYAINFVSDFQQVCDFLQNYVTTCIWNVV
jgi:hypothetical protein